ncbi:MAG: fluoride efflux transporter CrcB [Alphaproteobacteria bacterium]|nr:fluoride efflux transporter CrcB [Alphaproteobacteria bacterium]
MNLIVWVAIGGAIGSVGRYLVAGQVTRLIGAGFPWGTLAVNVIGGLVMGLLVEAMANAWSPSPGVRALLMVGVLGGFTTFSAFSLETTTLIERGVWGLALAYAVASVVLSVGALFAGLWIVRGLSA